MPMADTPLTSTSQFDILTPAICVHVLPNTTKALIADPIGLACVNEITFVRHVQYNRLTLGNGKWTKCTSIFSVMILSLKKIKINTLSLRARSPPYSVLFCLFCFGAERRLFYNTRDQRQTIRRTKTITLLSILMLLSSIALIDCTAISQFCRKAHFETETFAFL